MPVRRHFLPWERLLLPQAVEFLAREWTGEGTLDLSDLLVVVPTRQSGRRLREALASHAATRHAAVFPPKVMLPDSLVASLAVSADTAPPLISLLAWTEVFRSVVLDEFRAVFPVDPPLRDFPWALRLAHQFIQLQHVLVESGLRLADVATRAGDDFPEAERWRQISELETLHSEQLSALQLRDRHAVRIDAANSIESDLLPGPGSPLDGIKRIVMIGVCDPQPLALSVFAELARRWPVEVVVFAPAAEATAFDEWGRPVAEAWTGREMMLPQFEDRVHLCADPHAQAADAIDVLRHYDAPDDVVGVGVADTDVLPLFESALPQNGFVAFNPEGRRRRGDAVSQLVAALAALVGDDSFAAVEAFARCPDFLQFLGARGGPGFSSAEFLRTLDRLHARHLPSSLTEALRHAPDNAGLITIAEIRSVLASGAFPGNAATVLSAIFEARRFDLSRPGDAAIVESAGAWTGVLRDIASAIAAFPEVEAEHWWAVALRLHGETIHYDEKPAGAVELQGWLELLWDDAPHLVVAGFNDGRIPEAVVGDPFLPETLRERLGLKTNAARFARDAYLLQALAHSRASGGRLDLLVGKTSVAGDPLRPSRLLLQCADEDLPERIRFLFRPAEAARSSPSWRRAWKLAPRRTAAPPRVAVTALRAWLACPFRFYLGRVLRMEAVEPAKSELDVFDFGTVCHAALEAMGRSLALRDCVDASVLREFLLAALDAEARQRFGAELTLPLVVQLESARQRLSRAAEVQAATRAEGWVIERVEENFELDVDGLLVVGKIDRIDRHEQTGVVRVLDYKTSDRRVDPWQAHLRGIRREETPPEFARFILDGREQVWSDLQLPVYRRALQMGCVLPAGGKLPDGFVGSRAQILGAYFSLPKAASETAIQPWDACTEELDEAAWRCVRGVAAAIRQGEFWPPNENVRAEYDAFASLFHHGVADSVAWDEAGVRSSKSDAQAKERAT